MREYETEITPDSIEFKLWFQKNVLDRWNSTHELEDQLRPMTVPDKHNCSDCNLWDPFRAISCKIASSECVTSTNKPYWRPRSYV